MELFSGQETREYTQAITKRISDEISKMSDTEITTCDMQEWTAYLTEKYSVDPVVLYEDSTQQKFDKAQVKRHNPFYSHAPQFEPQYFVSEGCSISFEVPFDGEASLWYLKPSTYIWSRFEVADLDSPSGDECGKIVLQFDYSNKELKEKGTDMQKYVLQQFENEFKNYRTMIGYVNNEITRYNSSLPQIIQNALTARKEKADSYAYISQMLEIPLQPSPFSPNTKPIALKKVVRTPPRRPQSKPLPTEYSISDSDYENINNIILSAATTMEKTARTYFHNNEEELRDHLLASLNTHYEHATGETFRKIGKTDIQIEFENKAAFIGECKVWHGEKLFADAVQQVMNYSTWRDGKVSVIVFNKENQAFLPILTKVSLWVKNNTKSHKTPKNNMWVCDYYRADMGVTVKLTIMAFDLYVDKTQFKDTHR